MFNKISSFFGKFISYALLAIVLLVMFSFDAIGIDWLFMAEITWWNYLVIGIIWVLAIRWGSRFDFDTDISDSDLGD